MPCQSDPDDSYIYQQLDDATKAACEALTMIEETGVDFRHLSEATLAWWTEHKRKDAERKEFERELAETKLRRQQAMSKLSPEELKALGVWMTNT